MIAVAMRRKAPNRAGLSGYVGELSAVLEGQRLGFAPDHLDNHAAYLDSWLKVLRGDKRLLFMAAAHAQRAVDWLIAAAAKGGVTLDEGQGLDGSRGMTDTSAAKEMEMQHEAA